jgi:GNAT superfamily N-acetyltransferase
MAPQVQIRPLAATDVAAAEEVADTALSAVGPIDTAPPPREDRAQRGRARIAHLLSTDPGGAWVATAGGDVIGMAMSLVREGVWGLSLFAVAAEHQARGIGRRLLDASLKHGAPWRGGIVLSSTDPKAMRRYSRAGFALRPTVSASGIVARGAIGPLDGVRRGTEEDFAMADAVSREVRGAAHGSDLALLAAQGGFLVLDDEGYVFHRQGSPRLLAARSDEAAATLLRAALADAPPGTTVSVDWLDAQQDWAVRVALDAGLALSPGGCVFVRGELGPLRPYIPSGAYL